MLLNLPGFDEGNAREACKSAISPAILLVQGGWQTLTLIEERIELGPSLRNRSPPTDAIFRSELTGGSGQHAGRYTHPSSPNGERSVPGGAYHPPGR
jgi:hypothetical protein